MRKIYIVTGGSGFLGSHVVKQLEGNGESVVALVRSQKKAGKALSGDKAKLVYGSVLEIRDLEKLFGFYKDVQYVFIHTASIVALGGTRKEIKKMYETNINGVKNVIEVCKKHNARLLYVSSVHAIPEQPKRGLITEIEHFDAKKVIGDYAKSKAEASRLVMEAVKNGLDAVLVHPSAIIGPGDFSGTHMTQMAEDYRNGRIPAAVKGGYDFVDVRDVTAGIIAACEKGKSGECFLLTNKYYSVKEMFSILNGLGVGKKVRLTLPMWMAKMSLPILYLYFKIRGKRPLYNTYSLYTLKSNSNFSHDRASKELGYKPRGLDKSLKDMLNG